MAIYVTIDGTTTYYPRANGTVNLTPTPLASGTHSLRVAARSEYDSIQFQGLVLSAGASTQVPAAKSNLIEFVGDSITAGCCTLTNWVLNDYSWLTGEALNADHTQVAFSGICLQNAANCGENNIGMSVQFFKLQTIHYLNSPTWDFNRYQPNQVVINLGTNDWNTPDTTFQSTYTTFLQNVRAKYPNADIFVLRTFGGYKAAPTQAAVNARINAGDTKVRYVDTTGWVTSGDFDSDNLHPNMNGHIKIANRLTSVLRLTPTPTRTNPPASPTRTNPPPASPTPTALRTATSTATTPSAPNMLKNGSFELDNDANGRPDSWAGSNSVAAASFARSNTMKYGAAGSYSLRHRSTTDATYLVTQAVSGIQAGQPYRVSGWTNIPATSDSFTYSIEVLWRSAGGTPISTQLVKRYTAQTNGWSFGGGDYVAPSGATSAVVRMNVASLNATIYADVFNVRPAGAPSPTTVPPTATRTPTSGSAFALRIDTGATADYTDSAGQVWAADTGFSGGTALDRNTLTIANTEEDRLYQTERYGMTGYALSVPNGTYQVRLHLAETYEGITGAGQRVFSVTVEGVELANIDVYAEAGGRDSALVKTVVVTVGDGVLNLEFSATANNALVNAIEVSST